MSTPEPTAPTPAVFLDRDGTVLDELGYLGDPRGVRLYPGAARALTRLSAAGYALVLVTNQSGIARGLFSEEDYARVHARLVAELATEGVSLRAALHCPHHPEVGEPPLRRACDCRKPAPGLILRAAAEHDLDLSASWLVGDAHRDLESGRRAGVPGRILVRTGKGAATEAALTEDERRATIVVDDLDTATRHILAHGALRAGTE